MSLNYGFPSIYVPSLLLFVFQCINVLMMGRGGICQANGGNSVSATLLKNLHHGLGPKFPSISLKEKVMADYGGLGGSARHLCWVLTFLVLVGNVNPPPADSVGILSCDSDIMVRSLSFQQT